MLFNDRQSIVLLSLYKVTKLAEGLIICPPKKILLNVLSDWHEEMLMKIKRVDNQIILIFFFSIFLQFTPTNAEKKAKSQREIFIFDMPILKLCFR